MSTDAFFDLSSAGRIRGGGHDDFPEIAQLVACANAADPGAPIDLDAVVDWLELGRLIVLDLRPNELAAACIATARGVVFLVMHPDAACPALEQRMIGVAEALCESSRPRGSTLETSTRGHDRHAARHHVFTRS